MNDQTAIVIVATLAFVFACLWIFNGRQKRRFEDEQQARKRELERIKSAARSKNGE